MATVLKIKKSKKVALSLGGPTLIGFGPDIKPIGLVLTGRDLFGV